jgi:thioester reductase-like protein
LLTGATGFIGPFLLIELLARTDAQVYCLVRATDAIHGTKRIRAAIREYVGLTDVPEHRIVPVIGDLARPALGLDPGNQELLASTIDTIYHNGALVNHVFPYHLLRAPNVLGTWEVLRLACRVRPKRVHFISTLGVCSAAGRGSPVGEEVSVEFPEELTSGYVQSKWVGEELLRQASALGVLTTIYRPAHVFADSQTGRGNRDDVFSRILRSALELRLLPDAPFEQVTPVDYVSQAIVNLSLRTNTVGKVFHLLNTASIAPDEIIQAARSLGYELQRISAGAFYHRLAEAATNPEHPMAPYLETLRSRREPTDRRKITDANARRVLGTSITCPAVDVQAIARYIQYLLASPVD